MAILKNVIRSLRIRQWTKNITIFAALVFSGNADNITMVFRSALAFVLFSLCAGTVYIFNDIIDCEKDRCHPVKQHRPIASGRITMQMAWWLFSGLFMMSTLLSFMFSVPFGVSVVAYFLLQLLYTLKLKQMIILDVFSISFSFLIRVIAGALAIDVVISDWILVCTILLALFLALSKRRNEITLLETDASQHRAILAEYSPHLLDQMIGIVTSATLVAYIIFTLDAETVAKFGKMIVTVPFVLYGIFRYLYLVHKKHLGGQPEEVLLTDIPLQATVVLYGIVVIIMVYIV